MKVKSARLFYDHAVSERCLAPKILETVEAIDPGSEGVVLGTERTPCRVRAYMSLHVNKIRRFLAYTYSVFNLHTQPL